MKKSVYLCLLGVCFLTLAISALPVRRVIVSPPPSPQEKPKKEQFAANAYLPRGAGRRMVGAGTLTPVDIHIDEYSSDDEAKRMASALIDGGPDALHKALEDAKPKGRITLTGHVGFYDLKLIRNRVSESGRQIIAVTDRPLGFMEMYYGNPSQDYKIGMLVMNLKRTSKGKEEGEGSLIYAAKVKFKNNTVEIEHYSVEPVSLRNLRKW
jgi:hypothetical protein